MHLAIYKNYHEIVAMLIQSDFPVNLTTNTGISPLYIATALNHEEIADLILDDIL